MIELMTHFFHKIPHVIAGHLIPLFVVLTGCQGERGSTPSNESHSHQNLPQGPPHAKETEATVLTTMAQGPEAEIHSGFSVQADAFVVTAKELSIQQGQSGTFRIDVQPRGGWHINLNYPTRLSVEDSPELSVESRSFPKDESIELSPERLAFEVPVTGIDAGRHRMRGTLRFAVCAEGELCRAEKHEFVVHHNVESTT